MITLVATTSKAGTFSTSTTTTPIDTVGVETLPVGDGVTSTFVLVHTPNVSLGYVTCNGVNETLNFTGDTDPATWTYNYATNSLTRNPFHPGGAVAGPPGVGVVSTIGYAATLIEVTAAYSPAAPTVTDTYGNEWIGLTEYVNGGRIRKWYAYTFRPGKAGTGHTFTVSSGATLVGAVTVRAYAGKNLTYAGSENGATGTSLTSINGGAVLAPGAQALITASLGSSASPNFGTVSIAGGGLAIFAGINHVSSVTFGLHSADEIQTTAASRNPAWSWVTAGTAFAATAAYYEAGAPPLSPTWVTQAGVELAYVGPVGPVWVTQAGVELVYAGPRGTVWVTQAGVEIVYVGPLAPRVGSTVWMGDGGGKVWIE
jgi:hypothetical protein